MLCFSCCVLCGCDLQLLAVPGVGAAGAGAVAGAGVKQQQQQTGQHGASRLQQRVAAAVKCGVPRRMCTHVHCVCATCVCQVVPCTGNRVSGGSGRSLCSPEAHRACSLAFVNLMVVEGSLH